MKRFISILFFLCGLFLLKDAFALYSAGTNTVVSSITQTGARFSASITTDANSDATGVVSYSLDFYVTAPYNGRVGGASPSTVAVNGDRATTFTTTTAALSCGVTYTVSGIYLPDDFAVGSGYTSFTTSACSTPSLSVTNSPQVYTGSGIAATVACSSGGAVSNVRYNGSSTVPSAPGTYAITASCAATSTHSALTDASAGNFIISAAVPIVTAVSPSSGPAAGGTSITITGANFTGATAVTIGGNACTSVVVASATSITCTTPPGAPATASVLVTTPGGTNAANTLYSYVAAPAVTAIEPNTGSIAGGTNVTIRGTNFTNATAVTIGGAACTNLVVVSPTSITCTTPTGTAGAASVLVTTPGGTNAANTLFTYEVQTLATIPTLSEGAMMFMASLIAMFAMRRIRRQ